VWEDITGITFDNQAHSILGRNSPLVAIKNLVFADFRGCRLMFYLSRRILDFQVRERMCPTFVPQQQRITLRIITGILAALHHFHFSPVRVTAEPGGDTFRNDPATGIVTDMNHLCTGIRLLIIIGNRYRIKLTYRAISF